MGIQEITLVAGGEALVLQRVYQAAGEGVVHQDKLLFVRQVLGLGHQLQKLLLLGGGVAKERYSGAFLGSSTPTA